MKIDGKTLKYIRCSAGDTMKEMVKKTGYSLSTLEKVEYGTRNLSKNATIRVMKVYSISVDDLRAINATVGELVRAGLL
ncbi:helix-turn-helix domain-containing protein [Rossellomorea vietnamensis]|uniref:helix-turn-helix domain-containing protein n=1 Tax=Rossellomorea vietnamensis TaxID=218284 RepID=UPI003CF1B228